MSFLDQIGEKLERLGESVAVREMRSAAPRDATGRVMLARIAVARRALKDREIKPGDRVVMVAANSIDWAVLNLAIMSEGAISVPLYARQDAGELAAIVADCDPGLIVCGDDALRSELGGQVDQSRPLILLDDVFADGVAADVPPVDAFPGDHVVTIIYTSGTSGAAKGVMLTVGNVDHMLSCTTSRLDELLARVSGRQRIFHYLPFCFCGSWILLLTALSRGNLLMLSMDLERMGDEIAEAAPHFFMNVPTFLERIRRGVLEKIAERGGVAKAVFDRAERAWSRGGRSIADRFWLRLAHRLIFANVLKKISPELAGLVCGSAPLSQQTQSFFEMMGVAVLQVYGLTETTAICTMDRVGRPRLGGVGYAINGIEMKLGEHDEILVRGPNIFAGYFNRPAETASVMTDDWFRSGDQGQVDDDGNWRIVGRIKNLIILNSGHNIAPEPLEEKIAAAIPGAVQAMLVGNDRSFLTVIVTGDVDLSAVGGAIDRINITLPHYKRIRGYHVCREPFTPASGLMTANGKLRRAAIAEQMSDVIDEMYRRRAS